MGQGGSLAACGDKTECRCDASPDAPGEDTALQLLSDAKAEACNTDDYLMNGFLGKILASPEAKPQKLAPDDQAPASAAAHGTQKASEAAPCPPTAGVAQVLPVPKGPPEAKSPPGGPVPAKAAAPSAVPAAPFIPRYKAASVETPAAKPGAKPAAAKASAAAKTPPAKAKAKAKNAAAAPPKKMSEEERKAAKIAKLMDESEWTDEEEDAAPCPASKNEAAFEKELKKVKKGMKSGSKKGGQVDMTANPWMDSEMSLDQRIFKKEMFASFYREQYNRLKKKASPDIKQYSLDQTEALKIKGGHRPMPRPENVELPPDFRKPVGTISAKTLAEQYDANGTRKFVCIHGDLFDVSDRPDKYGADGPYWYMAGHDMTWGLVTGDDAEELMDKYYDVFKILPEEKADRKLQGLMSWWCFFEKEYGAPVGRLDVYQKEWTLPPPPAAGLEDGCSVM